MGGSPGGDRRRLTDGPEGSGTHSYVVFPDEYATKLRAAIKALPRHEQRAIAHLFDDLEAGKIVPEALKGCFPWMRVAASNYVVLCRPLAPTEDERAQTRPVYAVAKVVSEQEVAQAAKTLANWYERYQTWSAQPAK